MFRRNDRTNRIFYLLFIQKNIRKVRVFCCCYVELVLFGWIISDCSDICAIHLGNLKPFSLKVPWHAKSLLHILKAPVSTIILITNISGKDVDFMSYTNLKVRKRSSKYSFGNGDPLKLDGDSPTLTLAILKLNAWNFVVCSGAQPHCRPHNFKHLASVLFVPELGKF